jgi:apolipoprotein N-acyltransferase
MTLSATAYPLPLRIVVAALLTVSRGALLVLAGLAFFAPEPIPSARLLRAFWLLVLAPEAAVWILRYLFAATLSVDDDGIAAQLRTRRVEIPLSAVDAIVPWKLPMPAAGFWLRMRSGARFSDGFFVADAGGFLQALRESGASEVADRVSGHPSILFARSKYAAASRFDRPLYKYVLFALVPTVPLFRLRQLLAYGGTFGEYYDFGLKAYLLGFGIYWVLYGVYLLMYATLLRTVAEALSLGAAWAAPTYASGVRRACEIGQRALYFGGVPIVLILRFIPW